MEAGEDQFPSGWFGVAFTHELTPGAVLARRVNGDELALFRQGSGGVVALDAHCPHLGAHLGHAGSVVGDELRCGFHGFHFDGAGACTRTGYGTKPPPKARVRSHPVMEIHGVVAVWHDPAGGPPAWTPAAPERAGWCEPRTHEWTLPGRPQEVAENSVDLGHLSIVHGYGVPRLVGAVRFDGPLLRTDIAFERSFPRAGAYGVTVRASAEIHQHGLGLAVVDSAVPALGYEARFVVSSAAVDRGTVTVRVTSSVRSSRHNARLGAIGRGPIGALLDRVATRATGHAFGGEVAQDVPIWRHKRVLDQPALAQGDGPIGRYRQWARQFYSGPARRLVVLGDEPTVAAADPPIVPCADADARPPRSR
ncbi:MAG: Phenylpropionate dioxygenase [Myxococcaceae bacterium]|nr:Phenylpropionate dioxygenase [Myxococcaceae bacterium]